MTPAPWIKSCLTIRSPSAEVFYESVKFAFRFTAKAAWSFPFFARQAILAKYIKPWDWEQQEKSAEC